MIMREIQLFFSWIIVFIGIALLVISPRCVYKKIKVLTQAELTELPDEKISTLRDEKLTDRKMQLYYYAIVGITIMIVGLLLVLIFSGGLASLLK